MTEMYLIFGLAALFGFIALIAHRDEAIKKAYYDQMVNDHLQTCNAMLFCTRNDCERLIDAFYARWNGIIDDWELSTRTAALYKRVIETQKTREEMLKRQEKYRKP